MEIARNLRYVGSKLGSNSGKTSLAGNSTYSRAEAEVSEVTEESDTRTVLLSLV